MASFEPKSTVYKQRVENSFDQQNVMQTIGASLVSVQPGEVTIALPFDAKLTQQNGFLHAGIITTVVDSACGYAAYSLMPDEAEVLSIEMKTNLLSPAKGEHFIAVGKVIKPGRNIMFTQGELIAIDNGQQKTVATFSGTMMAIYR